MGPLKPARVAALLRPGAGKEEHLGEGVQGIHGGVRRRVLHRHDAHGHGPARGVDDHAAGDPVVDAVDPGDVHLRTRGVHHHDAHPAHPVLGLSRKSLRRDP